MKGIESENGQLDSMPLAKVAAGRKARVMGFANSMPQNRRSQLMAYGLMPGQELRVVQHAPVTVVQVDNTEVAMEAVLAANVLVEEL